jgi:hypothetical protein
MPFIFEGSVTTRDGITSDLEPGISEELLKSMLKEPGINDYSDIRIFNIHEPGVGVEFIAELQNNGRWKITINAVDDGDVISTTTETVAASDVWSRFKNEFPNPAPAAPQLNLNGGKRRKNRQLSMKRQSKRRVTRRRRSARK